jgi:hypothetical protein
MGIFFKLPKIFQLNGQIFRKISVFAFRGMAVKVRSRCGFLAKPECHELRWNTSSSPVGSASISSREETERRP